MDREPRDRQYISPTRVDRSIKREDITMQVEFVSKLMADNIDQEALIQILSEKIKEQQNQIELLQKQVDRLKEIIEKSIDMNNALARL